VYHYDTPLLIDSGEKISGGFELMQGSEAVAAAAITAGCTFFTAIRCFLSQAARSYSKQMPSAVALRQRVE